MAALAAALLLAASPAGGPLVSAGPLPPGVWAVSASGGEPLMRLNVDRGLVDWLDAGVGVDSAFGKFFRPGVGMRAKVFRLGCAGITGRASVSRVIAPRRRPSWGPRSVARTFDGEVGLAAAWAFGTDCWLGLFGEVSGMVSTDFSSVRTRMFRSTVAGVEWSPTRMLSLVARLGEMRGRGGARSVFSVGAALRF
jgi:hypothetical protein